MRDLARHLTRVGIRRREEKPPVAPAGSLDSWTPQARTEAGVAEPEEPPRQGRPPKGTRKRAVQMNVYLTAAEAQRVRRFMKRHDLASLSDAIRRLIDHALAEAK